MQLEWLRRGRVQHQKYTMRFYDLVDRDKPFAQDDVGALTMHTCNISGAREYRFAFARGGGDYTLPSDTDLQGAKTAAEVMVQLREGGTA